MPKDSPEQQSKFTLPVKFADEKRLTTATMVNLYYHHQQRFGIRALFKAMQLVWILNNAKLSHSRSANIWNRVIWLLRCSIIHLENAIDGRLYSADTFFGGRMNRPHELALRMLVSELERIQSYLKYVSSNDAWIHDKAVKKPVFFEYIFAESRMASDPEHGLVFPDSSIPDLMDIGIP